MSTYWLVSMDETGTSSTELGTNAYFVTILISVKTAILIRPRPILSIQGQVLLLFQCVHGLMHVEMKGKGGKVVEIDVEGVRTEVDFQDLGRSFKV